MDKQPSLSEFSRQKASTLKCVREQILTKQNLQLCLTRYSFFLQGAHRLESTSSGQMRTATLCCKPGTQDPRRYSDTDHRSLCRYTSTSCNRAKPLKSQPFQFRRGFQSRRSGPRCRRQQLLHMRVCGTWIPAVSDMVDKLQPRRRLCRLGHIMYPVSQTWPDQTAGLSGVPAMAPNSASGFLHKERLCS